MSLPSRIRAIFKRQKLEGDLDEELQFHVEMKTRENVRAGMSPEVARAAALRQFGNVARTKEKTRAAWTLPRLESIVQDIRFGSRQLRRNPGFSAATILIVALGIAAASVVFSFAKAAVIDELPYQDPLSLVTISLRNLKEGGTWDAVSAPVFLNWQKRGQEIGQFVATHWLSQTLVGGKEPAEVIGDEISEGGFQVLGVRPLLGRGFLPSDYDSTNPRAIVLSYPLWQRLFDGSPDALSRSVALDGVSYGIVGVMPPGFFTHGGLRAEYWIPLELDAKQKSDPNNRFLNVSGRLGRGVSVAQARAGLETLAEQMIPPESKATTELKVNVVPAFDQLIEHWRPALVVLFGAVALLLLIACVNVANLMLARASRRRQEVAVRVALGAGRRRVVAQLLTESLILSCFGGVAGILLAVFVTRPVLSLAPAKFNLQSTGANTVVLALAFAVSVVVGIGFGLAPAFQTSKVKLAESLKESSYSSTSSRGGIRTQSALIVSDVALSLILMIGAGLLLRSFIKLEGMNPGFKASGVLTLRVVLPRYQYRDKQQQIATYQQLLAKLRALPGVESSGFVTPLPLGRVYASVRFPFAPGMDTHGERELGTAFHSVSPGYFRTLEIPLLRGRYFTAEDNSQSAKVVIVNEAFARRYWPGQDPVGKQWKLGDPKTGPLMSVVGVVGNAKDTSLEENFQPVLYQPFTQYWMASFAGTLVARTRTPASTALAMQEAVRSLDAQAPVFQVERLEDVVSQASADKRLYLLLVGAFAVFALGLSAAGIAGTVSYAVAQRTHEIGIRMALGCDRGAILHLMMGRTLRLVAWGTGLGVVGSLALGKLVASQLYGVSPYDPWTLCFATIMLLGVSAVASHIPARRAAKVDPMVALRCE
jgi:putative ABC transport system permease protein